MGNFARSLGLARVTPVVGGYGFGSPHSVGGAIPVISSDPWIARRWGFQKRPQNTVQYKYSTWKKPSFLLVQYIRVGIHTGRRSGSKV